jgi:hypothetical protein
MASAIVQPASTVGPASIFAHAFRLNESALRSLASLQKPNRDCPAYTQRKYSFVDHGIRSSPLIFAIKLIALDFFSFACSLSPCTAWRKPMRSFEIYRFKDGKWIESESSKWFSETTKGDQDWHDALRVHGALHIEEYDTGGDRIDVFKTPLMWWVIFRDAEQALLVVNITSASDFIEFRAQYIAPNVQLMLLGEELDRLHRRERQMRLSGEVL